MISEAYIFGNSLVHRAPPGYKLFALMLFGSVLCTDWSGGLLICASLCLAGLYHMANIGIRPAYQAVAPVLWLIALLFLTHLWLDGVEVASFSVARLLILVLAASLVTITTRSSEFVDGIVAALRRGPAWLPAEKIALAISLTLRLLPSISITLAEIRIAQRARFLDGDIKALLGPLIVRTLKQSDNLAEAIHARSG